mmetsp:Transcript_1375/g.877  ORF Transcript_1375/g.877 Transcript_1375/m.877 type:complete len:135 (+) Transcript_1375:1399-1803(+)
MTQSINTIVLQAVQNQIDFAQNRATEAGLKKMINHLRTRDLTYIKLMYLDEALTALMESVRESIMSYFSRMESRLIILFVCFVILMLVGVIVCTTVGMAFLYKNFNATRSILNLIPGKNLVDLSDKVDLKKIQF